MPSGVYNHKCDNHADIEKCLNCTLPSCINCLSADFRRVKPKKPKPKEIQKPKEVKTMEVIKKPSAPVANVPKVADAVNPSYYKKGGIECFEVIGTMTRGLDGDIGFYLGCVIKYLWRFPEKNGIEDLQKARKYLDKIIEVCGHEQT